MTDCLICGSPVEPFMSFGQMPIANGFLLPEDFAREYFFELKVGFCSNCTMVQLTEPVERERMFHEHYAYFSSISARMAKHFEKFAESIKKRNLTSSDPFVVEIGSNDGIMLRHFAGDNVRHLGVEPSANVAKAAIEQGVNTICKFFDTDVAREIRDRYGSADVITGANVMCHIPYLHSIAEGVDQLMKPDGVLIFEDPYLGDIVDKTSYDQIYDEHAFYFSISSVSYLFSQHGMEVVDVEPQSTHGGSMRYTIARKGRRVPTSAVIERTDNEKVMGLNRRAIFDKLRSNIERSRDELVELLQQIKQKDNNIVGYGATSKSTTVLNYCGIGPDMIDFISDTTPTKQGMFTPGSHIPVRPYEEFTADYPDYALLFAWNHSEEIIAKEQKFMEAGGKWIVYVPAVRLLN
jgi:methylation protein EvaC